MHLLYHIVPVFSALREEPALLIGGRNDGVHLFHYFLRVLPDLGMEKELSKPQSSVIVGVCILRGLAWSFSTVRLISPVQQATSSSIEPERRNLFHLFFPAQRFIRFSTSWMALSLHSGHKTSRRTRDTALLTRWRQR